MAIVTLHECPLCGEDCYCEAGWDQCEHQCETGGADCYDAHSGKAGGDNGNRAS